MIVKTIKNKPFIFQQVNLTPEKYMYIIYNPLLITVKIFFEMKTLAVLILFAIFYYNAIIVTVIEIAIEYKKGSFLIPKSSHQRW